VEVKDGLVWFWIGTHADYDRLLSLVNESMQLMGRKAPRG